MAHTTVSAAHVQECIVECDSCHDVCVETIGYGLAAGGRLADAAHLTLLMDCAQICQTAADFMLRGSTLHTSTCRTCAEVCEACARSCERLDSPEMRTCADACRRCAESCRAMAG